jgi:hypothetical protein
MNDYVKGGASMPSKKSQGPMLFINQTKTPAKNMQQVYTNRQEIEQKEEVKQQEPLIKPASQKVNIEPSVPEKVPKVPPKQHSSFNRVKSFKELSIEERLEYLINFPKVLPPVPCVFQTDSDKYHGYLTDYQDSVVTIQFHDQSTVNIPVKDLKDIVMIGIKR